MLFCECVGKRGEGPDTRRKRRESYRAPSHGGKKKLALQRDIGRKEGTPKGEEGKNCRRKKGDDLDGKWVPLRKAGKQTTR